VTCPQTGSGSETARSAADGRSEGRSQVWTDRRSGVRRDRRLL